MVWYFPVLKYLYFPGWRQPSFQLIGYLAALIGIMTALYVFSRERQPTRHFIGSMMVAIVGVFFGARLFFFFGPWTWSASWTFTERVLEFLKFWTSGLVMWGGLLGGILFIVLYCRWQKLSSLKYLDMLSPMFVVTLLVARFGCLFANDHPAKVTSLPWGVLHFTTPSLLPFNLSRGYPVWQQHLPTHPAMLIYIAMMMALTLAVFSIYSRRSHRFMRGSLFLFTILSYSVLRFLNEFLRYYPWRFLGLTASQIIAIFTIMAVLFIIRRNGYSLRDFLEKLFYP